MSNVDGTTATGGSRYPRFPTPHDRVADALHISGTHITSKGQGHWRLRTVGPGKSSCNAVLEDEWLALSKPVTRGSIPAPDPATPLQLLRRNAALPGGVRYALVGDGDSLQLRADFPWKALLEHGPGLLAARVDQALPGFTGAPECAPTSAHDAAQETHRATVADDDGKDFESRLVALCDEAGWQADCRSTDEPRVEVALGEGCGVVAITRAAIGALFRTELICADLPADDSDCARAIGLLLLRAAGGVRMCRPVLDAHDDRPALQFQVLIGEPSMVAGEVDCALGALGVAAENCLREVELLSANPHLARLYLDTWKKRRSRTPSARKT